MKSSGPIYIVFGIIVALMIGLFIGLSLKIGNVNQSDISGTLTKINNFKKAQGAISGTEIHDQLLSDSIRLKNMQNYLRYYYTTSVKMAGDIRFSIDEANGAEVFKNKYLKEISNLDSYEKSFAPARIDLLIALRACLNPEKTDPHLLSEFVNRASNVIAQLNFRNRVVLDFIDVLDLYLKDNKSANLQGLTRAHDLLIYNELNNGFMTNDKLLIKSLNNLAFLSGIKNQKMVDPLDLKNLIKQDLDKLALLDADVPGLKGMEKFSLNDVDKLVFIDSGKLDNVDLKMPLNVKINTEKLGSPFWNN